MIPRIKSKELEELQGLESSQQWQKFAEKMTEILAKRGLTIQTHRISTTGEIIPL